MTGYLFLYILGLWMMGGKREKKGDLLSRRKGWLREGEHIVDYSTVLTNYLHVVLELFRLEGYWLY